jgi:uroporphyrin-III C-methyltransferase
MSEPKDNASERPAEPDQPAGQHGTRADWEELAASLAAGKPSAAKVDGSSQRVDTVTRVPVFAALALVLALIAIVVSGMLWWQYRQFYVSLDQTDDATASALERVRADVRALQDRAAGLEGTVSAERQATNALGARVDELPGRIADVERRLDAAQGGSFDARSHWLRSEAQYYLEVANTELTLAGHWENAIEALGLADERLAELADPSVAPVREAIADELLKLRGVRLPDTAGLVFSLGRLAARVDVLPMRADAPANYSGTSEPSDAEPGLGRLWLGIKRTLLALVHVERRDEPVPQTLSAAERELRRRQLELELDLARVAALRGESQAFKNSLQSAADILKRDFDATSADVEGALMLLAGMQDLDIAPARPSIGDSLKLLRSLSSGGN